MRIARKQVGPTYPNTFIFFPHDLRASPASLQPPALITHNPVQVPRRSCAVARLPSHPPFRLHTIESFVPLLGIEPFTNPGDCRASGDWREEAQYHGAVYPGGGAMPRCDMTMIAEIKTRLCSLFTTPLAFVIK
jgi:hypothetical protein